MPFDHLEVRIMLKRDSNHDIVFEFVWPRNLGFKAKQRGILELRDLIKVYILILEAKLRALYS